MTFGQLQTEPYRIGQEAMIGCAGEDERPHIAMDLSCGLFDLKTSEATEKAERIMNGTVPEVRLPSSEDDSASDPESESSEGGRQSAKQGSEDEPKDEEGFAGSTHGKMQGEGEQARKILRVRRTNAKIREL